MVQFSTDLGAAFVTAFAAIFSIVNPVGSALIFSRIAAEVDHGARADLARRVAVNAGLVLVVAAWAGGAILHLFGISLSALRIAGGLVLAVQAWRLLDQERRPDVAGAGSAVRSDDAFVPLTIPFTTGPGTIAAVIALAAARPSGLSEAVPFMAGLTAAAGAVALSVGVLYRSADRIVVLLGAARAGVVVRLSAFLLLCIGVEILLQGVRSPA